MASLRPLHEPVSTGSDSSPTPPSASAETTLTGEDASSSALEALKEQGNSKFKKGDVSGALEAYSRCIDACTSVLNSAAAPSEKRDGVSSSEGQNSFASSRVSVHEVKSVLAAAYCNRSMCRLKQQDASGAEADSRAALDLQPDYTKAFYRHAVALRALGDTKGAVTSLRRLLRVDPKNSDALSLLLELKDAVFKEEEEQHHSRLPSALVDAVVDPAEAEAKRVKALRDLRRMVQERPALQDVLAKEGLLQRLCIFLKQQNIAKPAAAADPAAAGRVLAAPASVEAAAWDLLAAMLQVSPIGVASDDSSSRGNSLAAKSDALLKMHEPLCIPPHIELSRQTIEKIWSSSDFLLALRRLLRLGVLEPPADGFASVFGSSSSCSATNNQRWQGLSAAFLLRVLGSLKQSACDSFEHDRDFLEAVSCGLDTISCSAVQLAALQSLAAAADARRRRGKKAKALMLRQGLEKCLEAALALLSTVEAEADSSLGGGGGGAAGAAPAPPTSAAGVAHSSRCEQRKLLERNIEMTVVSVLNLLGDKDRADRDAVDLQRLADQLLTPFLSGCCSKDASKQSDTAVGLRALLYFITADRETARDFIFQGTLLPYILSAATGEAAAAAGLSGTAQQRQQQQLATEVLLHCLDFVELRQKLLDEKGPEALLKLLNNKSLQPYHRGKLGVALARMCVHSKAIKAELFEKVDMIRLLEEFVQDFMMIADQRQQRGNQGDLARCVLELFFFLSLHAEFKIHLLAAAAQPQTGEKKDLITAIMEIARLFCGNGEAAAAGTSSSSSLPRYLVCGGLCNLMKSNADKERRHKSKGLQGGLDLDEGQLQELEELYERLPAEAKPVPNGEVDAGDEASALGLRQMLLDRGVAKLLVRACTVKPLPSANVLLAAGRAFGFLCKNEKARGKLVQDGVVRALLVSIAALKAFPEDQREMQQAAAQLCISVNPNLLPYHESLDLVPALLPLLSDGHELLQYEGALALTNLLSVSEDIRLRVATGRGWELLGELLFSENDLLRAAGLEGWCNLAACKRVQENLGGKTATANNIQDIRLLLAFCLETNNERAQQAAAGCLATLLNNSQIAKAIPRYDNFSNIMQAVEEATDQQGALLDRLAACLFNVWTEDLEGEKGAEVKRQIETTLQTHQHKFKGLAADLANQILCGEPVAGIQVPSEA